MKTLFLFFISFTFSFSVLSEEAILAGGCFWCVESDYEKIKGVTKAVSGYTGGDLENPDYKQVSNTETGHFEAVKITYDENIISYEEILDHFWINIDPFDAKGQFCDKGSSYLSAVFVLDESQKKIAETSKKKFEKKLNKGNFVTPILPAKKFWPAEEYHQDYYKKNPLRYKFYRNSCRRDQILKNIWGSVS